MEKVQALHPHWEGHLLLSADHVLVHAETGSRGTYTRSGELLTARWDEYDEETFLLEGKNYVSTKFTDKSCNGSTQDHPWSIDVVGSNLTSSRAKELPTVDCFDVFDTLLARRCGEPVNIFRSVELKANLPDFANMRQQAEALLYNSGQEYTLEDIYRRMITEHGVNEAMAHRLRDSELEEEYANLIPIAEHVHEVRPGDILVSDMYLPHEFIAGILREKCSLHFNPLFLSSHGKSSGRAWAALQHHFNIRAHTGDNYHSDITMAARHGISGRHTQTHAATERELKIAEIGYVGLASAVREARLGFWHSSPALRRLGQAQIASNFPMLFLLALRLLAVAKRENWDTILLSSRDCHLLFLVFRELATRLNTTIKPVYFFTSRVSRVDPSQGTLSYLHKLVTNTRAVIVDLCGTGWSVTRLLDRANRHDVPMFLMHWIDAPSLLQGYRTLADISIEPRPFYITRSGSNPVLEDFNIAGHEMVTDVVQIGNTSVPLFLQCERDSSYYESAACAEQAVKSALHCTRSISLSELMRYETVVTDADVEQSYHGLLEIDENKIMRARQNDENRLVTIAMKRER